MYNPNVYFDVAHNEQSFKSLCNFSNKINGKKILILALQKNKNIKSVISEIKSTFDVIIITQTNVRNFMPSLELSALFDSNKVKVIINTQKAIRNYKKIKKSDNIIIAGSHYLGTEISKEFKISFDNI
ncbi:MAG: glutamate ligase domain-containing protein [Candidatus Neomarinimicrobiota bacterium]